MKHKSELVRAILNRPQQKAFKEEFKIDPNKLTPIVTGYWKYVLLDKEKVYMFHRNHECAEWAAHEKDIYLWLNKLNKLQAPLLIDTVINKEISPYEILIVKRLHGVLLYEVMDDMTFSNLKKTCLDLVSHIAYWHDSDTKDLPDFYQNATVVDSSKEINSEDWLYQVLNPKTFDSSIDYVVKNLKKHLPNIDANKLKTELKPLLELELVLVHQDLHEAQILVNEKSPYEITGILDWESGRLLNPIIEFNFNEWFKPMWLKDIKGFQNIRLEMWNKYIQERKLKTEIKPEAILTLYNLYYSLCIPSWNSKTDNKEIFEKAKQYVLNELEVFIYKQDD